jgi:hypothetical protein
VYEKFEPKSFAQAGSLCTHEKSKQHQPRLMNGGGDDDFFFFKNNNRQRKRTFSTKNSSTTLTKTTIAKRFHADDDNWKQDLQRHIEAVHLEIRHFVLSELQGHVLVEVCLANHRRLVCTKAISVRSMSKTLSGARFVG